LLLGTEREYNHSQAELELWHVVLFGPWLGLGYYGLICVFIAVVGQVRLRVRTIFWGKEHRHLNVFTRDVAETTSGSGATTQ